MLAPSLASLVTVSVALSALPGHALPGIKDLRASDPCAVIAGQKWVAPSDVRACFSSFQVDPVEKANIITTCNRTLDFHASTNYQINAPEPFTSQVQEDIIRDLQRINETEYENDFEFHIDVSRSFKRLNDGHAFYHNYCYDYIYQNVIPLPLVHLTDELGSQHVHIAPEAFRVAVAEFPEQIEFWQNALPGDLKGKLETLSGAKVLLIDSKPPYEVVDENAAVTGGSQSLGTRQNFFFSSYHRTQERWDYVLGDFASQFLPLSDSVELTVLREGKDLPETFTIPFRSRNITSWVVPWTDSASFRANNCKAIGAITNGIDYYSFSPPGTTVEGSAGGVQQQVKISPDEPHEHPLSMALASPSNIVLPPDLIPTLPPLAGSYQSAQFYYLNETQTGVLALGDFNAPRYTIPGHLLIGLKNLKAIGAKQLIVDVTNNGGGVVCTAEWLHRIIAGARNTTIPQAGFYTEARAQPLAQAITATMVEGLDPRNRLLYTPVGRSFANNTPFEWDYDWLKDPVRKVINGREDFFSQKLGQECQPFGTVEPPDEELFDPKKVVIVSNGHCVSSCSLFSVAMNKLYGAKTVVFGGRNTVKQQYCHTVGGEAVEFPAINSQIKTTKLKDHSLSPPDFLTNSNVGITWRLGFGIWDTEKPEEWQDHPADVSLALTKENVNNPVAIWNDVIKAVF